MTPSPTTPFVPSTREITTAWVAYACYAVAIVMWWPSLVGLIVAYVRRGQPDTGFLDSHYRWLIRSFWGSLLGYLLCLLVILGSAWPLVSSAIRQAAQRGQWDAQVAISVDWSAIFATVGGAMLGGVGLLIVWCWFAYRVIRGALRLADGRGAP